MTNRDAYLRRVLYWLDALGDEDLGLASLAIASLVQEAANRAPLPTDRPALQAIRAGIAGMAPTVKA